jgi:hypothetical protein
LELAVFISKVFSFIFVCILAVCGNSISQTKNVNQPQQTKEQKLSLRMERAGCYGTCPIYSLNVEFDGKIFFEGKGYTKTIGKVEGNLSKEQVDALIAEIDKTNFFSLKDSYTEDSGNCPSTATDSSTVTIFVKLNDREKAITHYLGCSEKYEPIENNSSNIRVEKDWSKKIFPQQLYNLENKLMK